MSKLVSILMPQLYGEDSILEDIYDEIVGKFAYAFKNTVRNSGYVDIPISPSGTFIYLIE